MLHPKNLLGINTSYYTKPIKELPKSMATPESIAAIKAVKSTDITTNVDKLASIMALDYPHKTVEYGYGSPVKSTMD